MISYCFSHAHIIVLIRDLRSVYTFGYARSNGTMIPAGVSPGRSPSSLLYNMLSDRVVQHHVGLYVALILAYGVQMPTHVTRLLVPRLHHTRTLKYWQRRCS